MPDTPWSIPEPRRLVDFGLLEQAPRAILDNVQAQVFPLLADRRRLQYFLDRHYNDTFESCGIRFDVTSPVVVFTTLFYPTMYGFGRAEASVLEQDEYYFLVPVRVRRWQDGEEIEEVGVVTPYIYVSNAISTPMGRELFGWQKSVYRISEVLPRGARMAATEPYLEVQRPMPGRAGSPLRYRRVLALRHRNDAVPSHAGELSSRIFDTFDQLPRVLTLAARTVLSEMGARIPGLGILDQARALGTILRDVLHPNEELSIYSMVQFPHPSIGVLDAEGMPVYAAAFQALMRTELRVRNLRELGLLGTSPAGLLDSSRGFSLHLSGRGVDQVVTRLGLQVWDSERDADGDETQIVRPFYPSAARFDLEVSSLETLARRSAISDWTDGAGNILGRPVPGMAARYNTFLGPSSADGFSSYGRIRQEQSYRIIAVRAPLERLRQLCRELVPTPPGVTLTPRVAGEHGIVVFVVTRLPPTREPVDRLEWFSGAYLNIAIAADIEFEGASRLVFVETHGFTDNAHAFVVGRELLAADRWLMEVDESPQAWLPAGTPTGPDGNGRHMMSVRTDTLRALNAGDRVVMSPLFDIVECEGTGDHHDGESKARDELAPHIAEIFAEQRLRYLRADALRTIDADGVLRPSLVRCNVEDVYFSRRGVQADPPTWLGPHELYIYPYASIPIVRQLGLAAEAPARARFCDHGAPDPQRVLCPLAMGGHLPAARRGVLTLFECDEDGWRSNMMETFFHGPDAADDPEPRTTPPLDHGAPIEGGHHDAATGAAP